MKTFLSIAVVLTCIAAATAIKCYVCNSHVDPACGDFFHAESVSLKNSYLRTCSESLDGATPFCRKTKTYFEVTGQYRTHRDCGYNLRENYDCYQQRAEDYVNDVCQCHTDLCNGAQTQVVAAITLIVTFAIAAIL